MRPAAHIQQLIIDYLAGALPASQLPELEHALEDPVNRGYYESLKARLNTMGPVPLDSDMAGKIVVQCRRKRRQYTVAIGSAIAAAIFLPALLIYKSYHTTPTPVGADIIVKVDKQAPLDLSHSSGHFEGGSFRQADSTLAISGTDPTKIISIEVPAGKTFRLLLPDSSALLLNAHSSCQFPASFTAGRKVSLQGEGYFKVKGNSSSPFVVQSSDVAVTVLGTEFNVNAYDTGKVFVSLVQGAVRVSAGDSTLNLKPGWTATAGKSSIMLDLTDEEIATGWTRHIFSFNNKTLNSLAIDLARIYGVSVQVEGGGQDRITGSVDTRDLGASLAQLQKSGLLKYRFAAKDRLYISAQ